MEVLCESSHGFFSPEVESQVCDLSGTDFLGEHFAGPFVHIVSLPSCIFVVPHVSFGFSLSEFDFELSFLSLSLA